MTKMDGVVKFLVIAFFVVASVFAFYVFVATSNYRDSMNRMFPQAEHEQEEKIVSFKELLEKAWMAVKDHEFTANFDDLEWKGRDD